MVSRSFVHISPETGFRALLKVKLNTSVRLGTGAKRGVGGLNGQGEGERRGKTSQRSTSRQVHLDPKCKKHPSFIIFAI